MSASKNVDVVQKFIDSLVELFQDCFREAESEHKQQREIKLENKSVCEKAYKLPSLRNDKKCLG